MSDEDAAASVKKRYLEAGVPEDMLSNARLSAARLCAGASAGTITNSALKPAGFLDHQALIRALAEKAEK